MQWISITKCMCVCVWLCVWDGVFHSSFTAVIWATASSLLSMQTQEDVVRNTLNKWCCRQLERHNTTQSSCHVLQSCFQETVSRAECFRRTHVSRRDCHACVFWPINDSHKYWSTLFFVNVSFVRTTRARTTQNPFPWRLRWSLCSVSTVWLHVWKIAPSQAKQNNVSKH